jgi:hypothetical protein
VECVSNCRVGTAIQNMDNVKSGVGRWSAVNNACVLDPVCGFICQRLYAQLPTIPS